MADDSCDLHVRELRGRPTLCVHGELDLACSDALYRALDGLAAADPSSVLEAGGVAIELAECEFIDSAAIGILARVANAGIPLEIFGASGTVRRMLQMSGIGEHSRISVRDA